MHLLRAFASRPFLALLVQELRTSALLRSDHLRYADMQGIHVYTLHPDFAQSPDVDARIHRAFESMSNLKLLDVDVCLQAFPKRNRKSHTQPTEFPFAIQLSSLPNLRTLCIRVWGEHFDPSILGDLPKLERLQVQLTLGPISPVRFLSFLASLSDRPQGGLSALDIFSDVRISWLGKIIIN